MWLDNRVNSLGSTSLQNKQRLKNRLLVSQSTHNIVQARNTFLTVSQQLSNINLLAVLMIPCQLWCSTTRKDLQNRPSKLVQPHILCLHQLEDTASMSVMSPMLSRKENPHSLLFMRTGIYICIPEALVLENGLLQTDVDEHFTSPLLLPPCEVESSSKEGWNSYGGSKNVVAQTFWSDEPTTMLHQKPISSNLNISFSSKLISRVKSSVNQVHVLPIRQYVTPQSSNVTVSKYILGIPIGEHKSQLYQTTYV